MRFHQCERISFIYIEFNKEHEMAAEELNLLAELDYFLLYKFILGSQIGKGRRKNILYEVETIRDEIRAMKDKIEKSESEMLRIILIGAHIFQFIHIFYLGNRERRNRNWVIFAGQCF